MKVLFVSNLFPDAAHPNRGIYNARLVKHLGRLCEIRVVSPRPTRGVPPFWRPGQFESRGEDKIFSPLFPPTAYLPKIGDRWNYRLMARGLRATFNAVCREFPFEVVLVSWVYPDGCAVAELAREMNFPFVVIAQGSDVHQYLQMPVRRRIITDSLNRACAVITRSCALARLLHAAGVARNDLYPIYNGVEADLFRPSDRDIARATLGLSPMETVLLFVGNFLPVKNPLFVQNAFFELIRRNWRKNLRLVMIGEGPLGERIRQRAERSGLGRETLLPGRKTPAEVARYLQAADLLCVPSLNEGVPNVLYEAFSCGLRAVAAPVGGIPEVLTESFLGRLVEPDDPSHWAKAIEEILSTPPQTGPIVQFARQFSWERTATEHWHILQQTTLDRQTPGQNSGVDP
jgi:teichuronic acid biosynthesis glycosyltransferase TuaC